MMTRNEAMALGAWFEAACGIRFIEERIGIVADEPEKVTKGGIIIPGTAQRKTQRGYIVALGQGLSLEAWDQIGLHIGDRVLYNRYVSVVFQLPDQKGNVHRVEMFNYRDIYLSVSSDMQVEGYVQEQPKEGQHG